MALLATDLVLVDVGASGSPPEIWAPIADHATYVGFDPDSREMPMPGNPLFKRHVVVPKAITSDSAEDTVRFHLTRSPFCSSTLLPQTKLLSSYVYADLFDIVGEANMASTTLNAALNQVSVPRVDWLKLDTQGTDLRILRSLSEQHLAKLLAIDIEPGLQQNYFGEDTFTEVHQALIELGFWLSDLAVRGAVRMQPTTLNALRDVDPRLSRQAVEANVRTSPMWVEARYLRTLEALPGSHASQRDLVVLWLFSLLDKQVGYALDIAAEYERRYGRDRFWPMLRTIPQKALARRARFSSVRALIPARIKQWIKSRLH
jgi:FkbM family methyltransferase